MIEGSGSGRPQNILIRLRIRNTAYNYDSRIFDQLAWRFNHECKDRIPGEGLLCPACRAWVQTILPPQLASGKQLYDPAVTKYILYGGIQ